jgi:hypothetical protein
MDVEFGGEQLPPDAGRSFPRAGPIRIGALVLRLSRAS